MTKSEYVAWLECDKRAWIGVNDPGLKDFGEPQEPSQAMLEEGIELGRLARTYVGDFTKVHYERGRRCAARTVGRSLK